MKRTLAVVLLATAAFAQTQRTTINLPSSKKIIAPVPGNAQAVESFPATAVLSPDGRFLVLLNSGYGLQAGKLRQGLTVIDAASSASRFFPDDRLGKNAPQTYFIGLAFSSDGSRLYASIASTTDPLAKKKGALGNGIAIYKFDNGAVSPDRFIPIPPQPIAAGKKRARDLKNAPVGTAPPFPAGLAVISGKAADLLLVADNLSDDVLLLDTATGRILQRFDLSAGDWVPSQYPLHVIAANDGHRAWVSLWNASQVAELDLEKGTVLRRISLRPPKQPTQPGSHPAALSLSRTGAWLFVALANTDEVAVIRTATSEVEAYLSTRLPGQKYFGSVPTSIVQSPDTRHLFVSNAASDSVAVFDLTQSLPVTCDDCTREQAAGVKSRSSLKKDPIGHIPTEWYPTALAIRDNDLFIVTGKAQGTGPNSADANNFDNREHPYIEWLLHGSVAKVNIAVTLKSLPALTKEALDSNLMNGRADSIPFKSGRNPIKHVIYIIRENRTYDQVFGDMPVGNNDPSLVMYGRDVTPNAHALAAQFGLLDNFYDSGEVSGDGHLWSTAAITSDYNEQIVLIAYRGRERQYDFEGRVIGEYPLLQGIPDVNEPGSGYLWGNAARRGLTYRHYGEFISTSWCDRGGEGAPPGEAGTPLPPPGHCDKAAINKGEPLPPTLGDPRGGPSPWPWPVPMMSGNIATKPELRDHFDPWYADFRMEYPDQLRADEFLNEFARFVSDRQAGRDTLPNLIVMRLPNDHTIGTAAGKARPRANVADNDLALGRIVEAVSHSPYWNDTAILVLEDDAQNGADHVDAHRSIGLVISKYAPRTPRKDSVRIGAEDRLTSLVPNPFDIFVDSHFYTTVNMIRTLEVLLGLPPMNNNDAQAAVMAPLFSGDGSQAPFNAIWTNRDNGMIYEVNPPKTQGSAASARMDYTRPDAVDTEVLNRILWRDAKGNIPYPKPKHTVIPARLHGDDDD